MTKEEEGFLSAQADRFAGANREERTSACFARNDGGSFAVLWGSGLVMAREDADWSLKIEGLRGMLRPARLAESPDPDGRTKDPESS